MESGRPFCVAPLTWQDGLARYPPSESHKWNTIALQPEDYDEDFYNIIADLERRHQKNEFTDADFDHLSLTFCLITAQGERYNLIPNGSEIRVTKSNAYEFFQRVHSAYERLRQALMMSTPPAPVAPPPQSRVRATTTGLRLTAHDLPSIEWLCRSATNDPERLILPPGEKLRWAVVPPSSDFLIRLRPDGELCGVEPDDLPLFINEVMATMNEIKRAITNFGYYPPNNICTAPAELTEVTSVAETGVVPSPHAAPTPAPPPRASSGGRNAFYASARAAAAAATGQDRRYVPSVSAAELEKQRALFSHTHVTVDIFARFQEINV